jgi:hypothetical protein
MSGSFKHIVVGDFEYEVPDGGLPNPLCFVGHELDENLRHVRTIRQWRDDFGPKPPFDTGPDTLFVAYSAQAEMTCFLMIGWPFPEHIFDQHTAYLAASNVLLPYEPEKEKRAQQKKAQRGKRLPDACRAYGIEGWERIDKDDIARSIGEGTWRGKYSPQDVFTYCEEDVANSVKLLRKQLQPLLTLTGRVLLPAANTDRIIWWSEYSAKAVAQIQVRGMPIDVPLWNMVQENKGPVVAELLREFDPSYGGDNPIFAPDGEFSRKRFEQWLINSGIPFWPRKESGALDLSGDAFGIMVNYPGVSGVYALRESLSFITKSRLPIGRDGRNHPSLFPFGTATGRNAHRHSIYNTHAGMRSFMVFPEDKIGVYLDFRTQEIGVAAARSKDPALIHAYESGDIYHALARVCGLTLEADPKRWKENNKDQRQRMKSLQLGINYGMGVLSLARGLDRHPIVASGLLDQYWRTYRVFRQWRLDEVAAAMVERKIMSADGWTLRLTSSPNLRTLYNFPMQAGGADMQRLVAVRLCRAGIIPSMLVHDAILLEASNMEEVEHAMEIMRKAGRDVCDGLEIDVDAEPKLNKLVCGDRYRDSRPDAVRMWDALMRRLEALGVIKPGWRVAA